MSYYYLNRRDKIVEEIQKDETLTDVIRDMVSAGFCRYIDDIAGYFDDMKDIMVFDVLNANNKMAEKKNAEYFRFICDRITAVNKVSEKYMHEPFVEAGTEFTIWNVFNLSKAINAEEKALANKFPQRPETERSR